MKRSIIVIGVALAVAFTTSLTLRAQAGNPPGTVVLKGASLGGVKFDHAKHAKLADGKCVACHHPSKPEQALQKPNQNCQDCHTRTVTAPMKTRSQLAFHDGPAKKGVCIDCHLKAEAGKAPLKCNECHKKENV
jgi:hypothetical protein